MLIDLKSIFALKNIKLHFILFHLNFKDIFSKETDCGRRTVLDYKKRTANINIKNRDYIKIVSKK